MGNKTLIYKEKLKKALNESEIHLVRLKEAFNNIDMPLDKKKFQKILQDNVKLAFCDQIIYRYSKLQDTMGAKLFKSLMLYMGENIQRPFLDILYDLEKMGYISVEDWYEFRDIRNELSHNYEESDENYKIINFIYQNLDAFEEILKKIKDSL
ncbi:MAG: hypothetical protein GXO62_02490 [Epsilonproteobacteria bacterium]|nr:hypothetical protein [Campylobacterota bacterium]